MNAAPVSAFCSQCRLPLPSRPYRDSEDQALSFCCFGCLAVFRVVGAAGELGRANWFLAKLGLAALLAGNVMMFQSLLYFGSLKDLGPDVMRTSSWIMLALSAAVYLLLGVPMLAAAYRAAKQGRIVLETLIGFGALAAIGASAFETARGGSHLYYDSGTMVLVFVVLGQYLDARARQKATEALPPAVGRARRRARVNRGGQVLAVWPDDVKPGERVLVRAGEEIPVDGLVREGFSDVAETPLTGEPQPRLVHPNDRVLAGSIAVDGALVVEASGSSETMAQKIAEWTDRALRERAPLQIAADRIVSRFIPAVAVIAIATAAGWGVGRGLWEQGALAALSVLVVACPCALGIATPLATTIAFSRAAARGILLKTGATLESLASVRRVAFDKTGTLTRGAPVVVGLVVAAGKNEGRLLALAAAVEAEIDHPFARAIVEHARRRGIEIPSASDARAIPGGGAGAAVEGHRVLVGSAALLRSRGVPVPTGADSSGGDTNRIGVAQDREVVGEILVRDVTRPEARETVERLRRMGVSSCLLSGDRREAVQRVAQEVGLEVSLSELSPSEKRDAVARLRRAGDPLAMVGDGINDAPALAAADVGIAFGTATDLAKQAGDAVILGEDLRDVALLIWLARRTMSTIRTNLFWAFGYNAAGILMAAFGFLRPVVAAAAMVLSSLFVVGNSLRLRERPSHRAAPGSSVRAAPAVELPEAEEA